MPTTVHNSLLRNIKATVAYGEKSEVFSPTVTNNNKSSQDWEEKMAIPAQIVALYCLKFGLNAAIHTIIFIGTSDSYKRQFIFTWSQSWCKGKKLKFL